MAQSITAEFVRFLEGKGFTAVLTDPIEKPPLPTHQEWDTNTTISENQGKDGFNAEFEQQVRSFVQVKTSTGRPNAHSRAVIEALKVYENLAMAVHYEKTPVYHKREITHWKYRRRCFYLECPIIIEALTKSTLSVTLVSTVMHHYSGPKYGHRLFCFLDPWMAVIGYILRHSDVLLLMKARYPNIHNVI